MKTKRHGALKIFFRTIGIIISGCIVSLTLLVNFSTHSWFGDTVTIDGMSVSAATTRDIISEYSVDSQVNPQFLIIKKAANISYDPIIYFAVEGDEILQYIVHMNPLRLTSSSEYLNASGEYRVPIRSTVNVKQLTELVRGYNPKKGGSISGVIKIKYLSEFIDEQIPFEFTKKYLIDTFQQKGDRSLMAAYGQDAQDADGVITSLTAYVASQKAWRESQSSTDIKAAQAELSSSRLDDLSVEAYTLERFNMTDDQRQIAGIILPGLENYLNKVYTAFKAMSEVMKLKSLRITELEKENQSLQVQVSGLKDEVKLLKDENLTLRNTIGELSEQLEYKQKLIDFMLAKEAEQKAASDEEQVQPEAGSEPEEASLEINTEEQAEPSQVIDNNDQSVAEALQPHDVSAQ